MNLTRITWPKGWTPQADQFNGDPSGLLRMDNLTLDEQGALTLVRGLTQLTNSLPDYVYKFYSNILNSVEYVWAALNISGASVVRTSDLFGSVSTVLTAGGDKACFGSCLGQTLISCGSQKKKDNGSTVFNLGIDTPTAFPVINQINQQGLDCDTPGTWSGVTGTGFEALDPSALIFVDPVQLIGVILDTYPSPLDTVNFGVPNLRSTGDPGSDLFTCLFQPGDTNDFVKFRVEFCLDTDLSFNNYYWYEFPVQANGPATSSANGVTQGTSFLLGIDVQTTVSIYRNQFNRSGSDGTVDWTHVTACRITGFATAVNKFVAGQQTFTGGVQGVLNSTYQYCAIHVADNGIYQALSGPGPTSAPVVIYNGYASVQLPTTTDPQVTQTWLFRQSAPVQDPSTPLSLPQFYQVAVSTPGATVQDDLSDTAALELDIPLNPFLQSLLLVTDTIYGMTGLFNGRMLYITKDQILVSDILDPDAIDLRYTVKAFGDPSERNLFIQIFTNNTAILATTKDLYYISGTLNSLPDGTIDLTVQPIGEAYPPLSEDFAFTDGYIFYVGADGLRYTSGTNSIKVSQALNFLFQGLERYGIPPVNVIANNGGVYSLCTSHNRLYAVLPLLGGAIDRVLVVYDLASQTYLLRYTDPVTVFATKTDKLLVGYNLAASVNALAGGVFQGDSGDGVNSAGNTLIEGFPITFLTVSDANGQPRNRKDTFTLKIVANTGGSNCNVSIAVDKGSFINLGSINSTAETTFYFNLSGVTLGFRYAIQIVDANLVSYFKLYEMTIEYEPRPEQVNYKRLLPDNQGTLARKRWITYAFIIDTLGGNVTFTPYTDNVPGTSVTVNTATKLTFICYFDFELLGTDIGGILLSPTGQPFEFYQLLPEGTVSEQMPPPATYLVVPANNYGNPARKRFTSYKFQINTRGQACTIIPRVDGTNYPPLTFTTTEKRNVEYFFPTLEDVTGIDIGAVLQSNTTTPFEFYGVITPQAIEQLPPRLQSLYLPYDDFGGSYRKRVRTIPFTINTNGQDVTFTPLIDGVAQVSQTFNTSFKETVFYFFDSDVSGYKFGGTFIGSSPFEFYGLITPNTEVLPDLAQFQIIPANNYGVPARKRFTSYKFQINTFGEPCTVTPHVDGVDYAPFSFSTSEKRTVEYFFQQTLDVTGIDIGATLEANSPFEFYEVVVPEKVEQLPPRLESYYPTVTNYGSPARKRIRTIPLVINSNGSPVVYTPLVDGVPYPPKTFTTSYKQTVYYYFSSDVFGIDVGGNFIGNAPFEFYEFSQPETVEVLPVPKVFDQFQPLRFDKIGKMFVLRVRMIMTGSTTAVPLTVYGDASDTLQSNQSPLYTTSFPVTPNLDNVYEVFLPKNVNGTVMRVVLGPTADPFHRYDMQVKVATSGMESDSKWMSLR